MNAMDDYLAELPENRREAVIALRDTIREHLPDGYEEGFRDGCVSYFVPHSLCPDGYHCDPSAPVPFASISTRHKKMTLNLFCLYVDREAKDRFMTAWKETGNKLDMGAACVRFTKLANVPMEVVGEAIASMPVAPFLEKYEAIVPKSAAKKRGKHRS